MSRRQMVGRRRQQEPRLMVVEADPQRQQQILDLLRTQTTRTVNAKSIKEANEILHDANFIDFTFDGLIVADQLPDGSGWHVIEEFRSHFPALPVLLISTGEDLVLQIWAKAQNIPVVAPENIAQICGWLEKLLIAAA